MYHTVYKTAQIIAHSLAYAGGFVLICLIGLTVISIIGRAFVPLDIGIGPIRGIYDVTELGMAAAIFAFLPLAQLDDAHAKIDLFKSVFPAVVNRLLELVFNSVMAVIAGTGSWRLCLGMQDKMLYGETTVIAQIPLWYGYAAGLCGAIGFVVVSLFCVWRSTLRLFYQGCEPESQSDMRGTNDTS